MNFTVLPGPAVQNIVGANRSTTNDNYAAFAAVQFGVLIVLVRA